MFAHTWHLFWWKKLHNATEWQWQDKTQIIKIIIDNIQNRQFSVYRCVRCKFEMKNKYMWWINNYIIVLCVPRLISSVQEMDCLGKETVSVSGRSGAQSSVALTRLVTVQKGFCWMWGDFASLFALSGRVQFLEWGGLYQWFAQQSGLPYSVFWGQIW